MKAGSTTQDETDALEAESVIDGPWWRRLALRIPWRRRCKYGYRLRILEDRLGYTFRDRELLLTALTHPSSRDYNGNGDSDNQRLEFLGDAVLGFLVAADLYRRHQDHPEGVLTSIRSRVTNGRKLGGIAREIGLGDFVRMARSEIRMGGRKRVSTLADALESVFGAAYLDGGMTAVQCIFQRLMGPTLCETYHDLWAENPKGKLQCLAQRMLRQDPEYRVTAQNGSRHKPVFTVEVLLRDEVVGHGDGSSKRQAQFAAARTALKTLAERKGHDPAPLVVGDADQEG